MTHPCLLQPATDRDSLARLSKLAHAIWQTHYVPIIGQAQVDYMLGEGYNIQALEALAATGSFFTLAVRNKRDIGFAAVSPDTQDSHIAWLGKLYVHIDARRTGVASALLEWARQQARALNASQLWLRVNKHNAGSIAAYERLGFVIDREDVKDIGHGFVMDDYLMRSELEPLA